MVFSNILAEVQKTKKSFFFFSVILYSRYFFANLKRRFSGDSNWGEGGGSGKGIVTMRKAVEPIFITRCSSKKMFIVGCGLWRRLVGQA
jgi:hypothetical protein